MTTVLKAKPRMRGVERRELIRNEAGKLFGKHGYAATRLDDVATAAGVTKPMIYRHFASKKDLYVALLERHEQDLPTFIKVVDVAPGASSAEVVEAILDGWLDYAHEHSYSWLVIFRDTTRDPDIEAARRRVNGRAHEVIAAFARRIDPHLAPELVEPTAEFLSRGLAGLVLWWIDHPDVPKATVHAAATRACVALLELVRTAPRG